MEERNIYIREAKSNIRGYLIFAILGGFVAYMIWNNPSVDVDIKKYQTEINLLQLKIDSIQTTNKKLMVEADSINKVILEYDSAIKRLNTKIYVIQKETEKKLDSIDNLGGSQLQEFFTKRYRQYENSSN